MLQNGNNKRRFNKKRNPEKRFVQNAKGFGKKGSCGRGSHINDDDYQYFIKVMDAKNSSDYEDIKTTMADNTIEHTKSQEVHFASNQVASKVIESLIGFVNEENFERFMEVFAEDVRPICSDSFASHVLEKMIEIAALRAWGSDKLKSIGINDEKKSDNNDDDISAKRQKLVEKIDEETYNLTTDYSENHRQKCAQFVERISKFVLNNLEDFVWDSYGSHIMSCCILHLAGVHETKEAFKKKEIDLKTCKLFEVPDNWLEIMKEFPQRLQMWPQFAELPYHALSASLLKKIIYALKATDTKMLKNFGNKLLNEAFLIEYKEENETCDDGKEDKKNNDSTVELVKVFHFPAAMQVLEALILVAGQKLYTQIYLLLFQGRLDVLAKTDITNFAIQKLLRRVKVKEDFESMFAELTDNVEDFIKKGHTGIVAALVETCRRLVTKQAQVFVVLQKALNCQNIEKDKANPFFISLIKLKPSQIATTDNTNYISLHGSLIAQHILNFNKPILMVNCILATSADKLFDLFNTAKGSHVVDSFFESQFVGEKSRDKFIKHFDDYFVDLAISKFGSNIFEKIFNAAQETSQQHIVKKLAAQNNKLKSTLFGRIINDKLHVETFSLSKGQWAAIMQTKKKRKDNNENINKDITE